MFENFRGMEYGWEYEPFFQEARTRSNTFYIYEGLLRQDVYAAWKREAVEVLKEVASDVRLGTVQDEIRQGFDVWRKFLAVARLNIPKLFPLGTDGQAIIFDREKSFKQLPFWHPKFNYQNDVIHVMENRIPQSRMDELLELLKKLSGTDRITQADDESKKQMIQMVKEEKKNANPPFYMAVAFGWLPKSQEPEQMEAEDYAEACYRFQASEAGRKAKRLLIENLTDVQVEDYYRHGYFFVVPRHQDGPLHERRIYAIARGFPNGNVMRVQQKESRGNKWLWYPQTQYCFHTEEPHAVDDIILGQKLMLENEEADFLKGSHPSKPHIKLPLSNAQFARSI